MEVTLVGLGPGSTCALTGEARAALQNADVLVGAARLLNGLPGGLPGRVLPPATKAAEIIAALRASGAVRPCVVLSGDTGFYSGAARLTEQLLRGGDTLRVLPGLSSPQVLAARLGCAWQSWAMVSAHGAAADPVAALMAHEEVFFLTGGETPGGLCAALTAAGLGDCRAVVGENLSYPDEAVTQGSCAELAGRSFAPLSVLLVTRAPFARPAEGPGIPDALFLREEGVPMTKQEVRAVLLAKLALRPGETAWDVGAGTGSVSVELALAGAGRVYAVERKPAALALLEQNRARFAAYTVVPVEGAAPDALAALPAPDAAFVGGSGGELAQILAVLTQKNPQVRVCIAAVAAETLARAVTALDEQHFDYEVTQLAAARSRSVAGYHLMTAQNPVWLLTGQKS